MRMYCIGTLWMNVFDTKMSEYHSHFSGYIFSMCVFGQCSLPGCVVRTANSSGGWRINRILSGREKKALLQTENYVDLKKCPCRKSFRKRFYKLYALQLTTMFNNNKKKDFSCMKSKIVHFANCSMGSLFTDSLSKTIMSKRNLRHSLWMSSNGTIALWWPPLWCIATRFRWLLYLYLLLQGLTLSWL